MKSKNPFKQFLKLIAYDGLESMGRHYSCYRGFVAENKDPKNLDRLFVTVPHISGTKQEGNWAWPKGKSHTNRDIPKLGDMVWVEFERGDYRYPVWSFCHQPVLENEEHDPAIKSYEGENGSAVVINDKEDSIDIEHHNGSKVKIYKDRTEIWEHNGSKITLKDGEIHLNGEENGGLIKISELVNRIQRLENLMNTHIHPTPLFPTMQQATPIANITQIRDLENTKVKH